MNPTLLILSPARLVVDRDGSGVRAVLPSLDLALRRGAAVVLLWGPGQDEEARSWSVEALGGSPWIAGDPGTWEAEARRLAKGRAATVGISDSLADLPWLAATSRPCLIGHAAPGAATVPGPAPLGWRRAVEEALALATP